MSKLSSPTRTSWSWGEQSVYRKSTATDLYISKERRKRCKPNLREIICICYWSQHQLTTSFRRSRLSNGGGAGRFVVCAIHTSRQKDCFSQTIVALNKWVQARPSTLLVFAASFIRLGNYTGITSQPDFSPIRQRQARYHTIKLTLNEQLLGASALLLVCHVLTGWLHGEKVTWRQQRTAEPRWVALNISVYHVLPVAIPTDSGLCSQCQTYPSSFF